MSSVRGARRVYHRGVPQILPPILLLDDYPDTCEAVAVWLEMEGWKSVSCASAESAIEVLSRERVAAIVMEPHLRSGAAMHVARAARASPFGRPLLVSMSASGREGDHTAYEPTLFDFNLVKPVPLDVLGRILTRLRTTFGER